jgi:murein DD-endopeptidase MepM/ murein hydrolase activator NlpD
LTDIKDKPGYENPLVDESGAVKSASNVPHPREADIEQKKLDDFGGASNESKSTKSSGDFAPSMNDVTASSINAVTNGKFLGKFNINITNKQKAGGAGLFVGLILLILGLISLGPLQFIHMSQLLSQFHFSKQSDLTDNRFRKMMRYMRNPNNPEKTRLGYFANKSADKLTAKLSEKGIKPVYGTGGYSTGFEVDVNKMKNDADFGRLIVGDGDNDATRANIANEFGANVTKDGDGKLIIKPDGNDYYKDKKFTKFIVKAAGLEGKIFATKARRLNIRGGNAGLFHPIKKSVANKIDDIIAARKEKLKIKDTESTPLSTDNKNTEENPSAEAEANEIADDANKVRAEAKKGGFATLFNTGNIAKTGLGAISLTGFTCLFNSLSNTIYDSQASNVLTPLMNSGVEAIAIGNQVMSGDDLDLLTLGAYSTNLYSKDYGSWENAKSIQANLGNKDKGTPQPAEAALNVNNNAALIFLKNLESASVFGADGSIETICKPAVQAGTAVVSVVAAVFSGGSTVGGRLAVLGEQIVKATASVVASGVLMDQVDKAIVGDPINVLDYHGGQFGSLVDSGAFLAGNEAFLDSGGQLLDAEQSAEVAKNQQYVLRQEKKNRSIYDKYINPVQYDSAVAQLIDDQSYNTTKSLSSIPTTFFGSFSDSFKNLAGIFSPQIYAQNNTTGAATFDYGLPYAGFTQSQIDNPIVDNPEKNYEEAVKLINEPVDIDGQDDNNYTYKQLFLECNNLNVTDELESTPENKDQSSLYQSNPNGGSEPGIENLTKDGKCGKSGDEKLLRLRFAIFDMQTAQAAACQLGDDEACTSLGIETTKSNEVCPDGTVVSGTGEAGKIYWPLEETNPNLGDDTHDLTASIGTPVHAVTDGTVVESKDLPGCDGRKCGDGMQSYGRQITIDHGGKLGTVNYAHFSKRMVEKGDKVVAGQVIGLSGEAGNARGPHLHIDNNGSAGAYAILKELGAEKPPKSTSGSTGSSCSTPASVSSEGWAFPIKADPKKRVMSCFAEPVSSGRGAHPGIDFEAPLGTPVYADYDGVIMDNNKGIYGGSYNILEIDHGNGLYSVYEHLGKHDVKPGDRVTAGQQIAVTGTAELTHAWHLHYGITKDPKQAWYSSMGQGKLVNPLIYINDNKPFGRCKVTPKSQ